MTNISSLFTDFAFTALSSTDFKEDAVREELIMPLLQHLGYGPKLPGRIHRGKKLKHPFVMIGSKKRPVLTYPDYLLTVDDRPKFILDAKGPHEPIHSGENVEQAFFYAIHPDVRVELFALCNGHDLTVFHVSNAFPILSVALSEISAHWTGVASLLASSVGVKEPIAAIDNPPHPVGEKNYFEAKTPTQLKSVSRQTARRHFGVHGYFTKQPWTLVHEYIRVFSQSGDLVLDPFGGGGVTLIEAMMLGRRAIHVDINPLSQFIVKSLITPVDFSLLENEFERVCREFVAAKPTSDAGIEAALSRYPYPRGIALPKDADVRTIEELFTPRQLAELAILKASILKTGDDAVRQSLLLMFSGLLNKINLTYHASEGRSEGRGDSAIFRYYRYRVAPKPAELDTLKYLLLRYRGVVAAKREIEPRINKNTIGSAIVRQGSATDLSWIAAESVDFIFTDPPYGAKIAYLDLSVMWTAWLDLDVTAEDFQLEAIEGGEHGKSKEEYGVLVATSIAEMARVLKYDRWMSFVFAHQTPGYWYMIVEAAEKAGFEYAGAVTQRSGQVSFKKRQNPFTVLSGELIINFKKVRTPKVIARFALGAPVMDVVINNIEAVIAKNHGATIEEINDELIIRGLELGFLDLLAKEYSDLTPLLKDLYDYDESSYRYQIRKNSKFKSHIPLELRVRYFVVSYLRRAEHEQNWPTFDDVVLNVMPLLKNGVTPEEETIRAVLEEVAERVSKDRWRLQKKAQMTLFT